MLRIPTRQLRPTASPHRSSFRPILEALEDRCVPATFSVDTQLDTVDANPGDGLAADAGGLTSLRAAIMEANALAGADEIVLPAGTYLRTVLGTGENAAATGDLDIKDSLTLTGAGAATTIIDAAGIDRVIEILGVVPVTISGVTIKRGDAGTEFFGGGGVRLGFGPGTGAYTLTLTDCIISDNIAVNGGGINNDDTQNNSLVLVRTTVSNNRAITDGGGIAHGPDGAGSLTLTDCIVSNNTADGGAGGILAAAATPSDLTITGSTISGNSAATGIAGGIEWFGSTFVLTNSTISGNTAATDGGGLFTAGGIVTLTNSTISGNSVGRNGGGIANFGGTYTLTNVTITNNFADNDNNGAGDGNGNGGGIFNSPGTVNLLNTIVGGNTDRGGQAPDCSGTITSQGHNLIQSTAGCTITGVTTGNITGQDPLLGDLADNGGPTLTHLPQAGSPAIDAGTSTGAPVNDQRGISRPQDAGVDIGAVEVGGATTGADLNVEKTAATSTVNSGAQITYTFVVSNVGDSAAEDVAVSDLVPANTTFESFAAPPGWAVQTPSAGAAGAISATLAGLAAGDSATFTLVVRVDAATPGNTVISNTAQVAAGNDSNPNNNTASVDVTALRPEPPAPARRKRLTITLVSKSTAFHNELGLFVVDNAAGRIGHRRPGDPGYAAAALARRHVLFTGSDPAGTVRRLNLPADAKFGLYLVQNGSSAGAVARNRDNQLGGRPRVFFSFTAANPDRFAHLRSLSARQFAFEDLTGGGDRDFNDLVARFSVAAR